MTTIRNFIRNSALGLAATAVPVTVIAAHENSSSAKAVAKLKVGVAREIITPKLGTLLMGYGSNEGCTAVHDDLTVTVIAIEDGKNRALLMSACVCMIGNELCSQVRKLCGEAVGIPASNVMLGVTHTHSGPITNDTEYCNSIFVPKCIAAAKASVKEMKPVTVGVAKTESKVGINRRQLLPNDRVILGQNPWGAYDSEMTVVSFKGEDGKNLANIVHCTAHCTAIGSNTEVSRDWAGFMVDRLEEESGNAITMFYQGMQGDVAPRMANGGSTGNMSHAMEVGAMAGLDAVRAYKDIRVYRDEELSVVTGEVRLPHAPLMPLDEARSELSKLEARTPDRWTEGNRSNLTRIIELHEKGETGESFFTHDQTLVRIGPIVLIPVPFEASSEISFRFRTYSKYGHTLALGLTNGSNSYLVTQDQICRGGYEVDRFNSRSRQLANNVDWHLVTQNLQLMEKL
jgi:hypothetical protein